MKTSLYLTPLCALALVACGSNETQDEAVDGSAPDVADASQPADDADKYARGNEYNPQDGEDIGLPMGLRLFPDASVTAQDDTSVTFTSDAAQMQVLDWYYRKLDQRGFDIKVEQMKNFTANGEGGTVTFETLDDGYRVSANPGG